MRRAVLLIVTLAGLTLAGCGGGSSRVPGASGVAKTGTTATTGTPAEVIRGWSEALRGGDLAKASSYFVLPSVVANGTPPVELHSRFQVRGFNQALPCGAQYLRSTSHHGFVIAEFRLTDRTGPGAERPCQGKGAKADVAFRIARGKIVEWRRAAGYPGEGPQDAPPAGNNFT